MFDLCDCYGIVGTYTFACPTLDAFFRQDLMLLVGCDGNRFRRALLGTNGTADTPVGDGITNKRFAPLRGTNSF